jgi:polyferredoxin
MDKLAYPRGLVRYTTENGMTQGWTRAQMLRRALRPRVLVYTAVLLAVSLVVAIGLTLRTPFKVDVVRDRAALARIVEGGRIENVYRLQIMNATETTQRYRIEASGIAGLGVYSDAQPEVGPAESRWVALRLQIPFDAMPAGSHPVRIEVGQSDGDAHVSEKSVFIVPR